MGFLRSLGGAKKARAAQQQSALEQEFLRSRIEINRAIAFQKITGSQQSGAQKAQQNAANLNYLSTVLQPAVSGGLMNSLPQAEKENLLNSLTQLAHQLPPAQLRGAVDSIMDDLRSNKTAQVVAERLSPFATSQINNQKKRVTQRIGSTRRLITENVSDSAAQLRLAVQDFPEISTSLPTNLLSLSRRQLDGLIAAQPILVADDEVRNAVINLHAIGRARQEVLVNELKDAQYQQDVIRNPTLQVASVQDADAASLPGAPNTGLRIFQQLLDNGTFDQVGDVAQAVSILDAEARRFGFFLGFGEGRTRELLANDPRTTHLIAAELEAMGSEPPPVAPPATPRQDTITVQAGPFAGVTFPREMTRDQLIALRKEIFTQEIAAGGPAKPIAEDELRSLLEAQGVRVK